MRLRYIDRFKDRYGTERLYFRRPGGKRTPLPPMDDPGFMAAYVAALSEGAEKKRRGEAGTFDALAELYYRSTTYARLKPSTRAKNRGLIDRFCEEHGHRPVRTLTRDKVEAIIAKKAATPAGANNLLKILRMLIGFAIANGWRTDDPTAKIKKFREGTYHTWTEDEIAAFEAKWPLGTRERLAFALHLYTGQRRHDVATMTWGAYDARTGLIQVRQEKTGAALAIAVHRDLRAALDTAARDHVVILTTLWGKPFSVPSYGNWMAKAIADAGLPDRCVLHGVRKAAARRLAEAGCTANEIMAITGHKTMSEAARYTREAAQKGLGSAAVVKLEERFGDSKNPTLGNRTSKRTEKPS